MSVLECYKRQNRIKKPFFLLCMVFLASCLVFWSYVEIVNSYTILDHLLVAYLYTDFNLPYKISKLYYISKTQKAHPAFHAE